MDKKTKQLQTDINRVFVDAFGHTPLAERIEDIKREAGEVARFTTLRSLKGEAGDLLTSVIQLCNECDWDVAELVQENLFKIRSRQAQYKALGRKVKVAILGGAFNPITTGHIQIAKYVLDTAVEFDEVWLAPCFGHMNGKDMATPDHRLKMVQLACECDRRLKPFSYEIDHQLAGETYYFVKRLMAESFANDRYNFSYIIGQDNANNFDRWVSFQYLQKAIRFVVVPRMGVKPDAKVQWYRNEFHICLPPSDALIEISSTAVREMIVENNQAVNKYLDPKVLAYIQEHNLYRD